MNKKPQLCTGELEGAKISHVACGSSHSIAWCGNSQVTVPYVPVPLSTIKDPLGSSFMKVRYLYIYVRIKNIFKFSS